MGLARYQASTLPHGTSKQALLTLNALPSPSSDVSVTSPVPTPSSPSLAAALSQSLWPLASTASQGEGVIDPQPLPVQPVSTMYSETTDQYSRGLRHHTLIHRPTRSPVTRSSTKDSHDLRLPSFEALGIANPHPHSNRSYFDPTIPTVTGSSSDEVLCNPSTVTPSFDPSHPLGDFGALTPPADSVDPQWKPGPGFTASAQPCTTGRGEIEHQSVSGMERGDQDTGVSLPHEQPPVEPPFTSSSGIQGAIETLRRNIRALPSTTGSLRVLSHALPCPSPNGYSSSNLISAIHDSTPLNPTVWINVFHAVPGRFNLADLPSSPPATPGPAVGGEDYFTQKVFDSAVPVSDYLESWQTLPRSPRPIVPPSSINVSILERYIPPSSPNEFINMFNVNRSSILIDRLVELSPQNGSLVFIYPTKQGARTFMDEYLSPVLDPLLRTMVVVHNLSSDLCPKLGRMSASNDLWDHDTVKRKIEHLCSRLSNRSSEMDRYHEKRARYELSYSSTQNVQLEKTAWSQYWWVKQEKTRIRDTIQKYVHEAQARINNEQAERMGGPIPLMQQLLDGVVKRPYAPGEEPHNGVEVSVFVITRTE